MAVENGLVLARVRPFTGRKHQIRVQLAHEGLPILGDPLYGRSRSHNPGDGPQRLWLDAHRLAIRDFPGPPGNGILAGVWNSSRRPTEFFRHAARSTDRLEQPPGSVMPPG
jgi:hypothetical protein